MVYSRFICRDASFAILSLSVVLLVTEVEAQQAERKPEQAQHTRDKQASQDPTKPKAKGAKTAVVKAKIKPRREAPVRVPSRATKSKAKPAVARAKLNTKRETRAKTAAAKVPTLSKSKRTTGKKQAEGPDKTNTSQSSKTKAVAANAKPAKQPAKVTLQQAKTLLDSDESDKVRRGLKHLEAIGNRTITAPIVARLQQGLPPTLVKAAIEALVKAKNASAAQVLIELCEHRRAAIRAAAISALGSLKIRKAYPVVRKAIDDSDPSVRSAATKVLSQLGRRKALKDLYLVFEGGDIDVVPEIAKWVTTRDTDRLTGYLKDHSFSTLKPAFVELLDNKRTSVREKTKLIARLGDVGTPEAQKFLRDYMNELPTAGRKPLTNAIEKALQNGRKPEVTEPEPEAKSNKKSASKKQEAK